MKQMSDREARMRALLARYDECLTTEEEELELQQLLAEVEPLSADLQAATVTFDGLAALASAILNACILTPYCPNVRTTSLILPVLFSKKTDNCLIVIHSSFCRLYQYTLIPYTF